MALADTMYTNSSNHNDIHSIPDGCAACGFLKQQPFKTETFEPMFFAMYKKHRF